MTIHEQSEKANRLIDSTSPYLLQHAHNPVEWYPWGAEALTRAKKEDKPILLSIGYSACHWCHVMAHESFEDPETAALMNQYFINIKVDREERPDLDAIYMEAVQAMTGGGGWPMTVFLTPEGKPFYGGTYYPPVPRHGMPSFRQVLRAIADAWEDRRQELASAGERLVDSLSRSAMITAGEANLTPDLLDKATARLMSDFDRKEGGFGGAPKFPQPMNLDFLLQSYQRTKDEEVLRAVALTLSKMAKGGIYDHLGGGFHRYSTDARWLVPHFEKMLYDNAQLARVYLHAWQLTGDPLYRRVVEETLDYLQREMTAPDGGFYSTQDADTDGEEGAFFLWTPGEVEALLGKDAARLFMAYYGITTEGNFREGGPGKNILHISRDLEDVARDLGVSRDHLASALASGRETLFQARARRPKPALDDKMLAEWNGLAIRAFAEAGAALDRPDYLAEALRAADFVLEWLTFTPNDGTLRLYRSCRENKPQVNGYLEDYTAIGLAMLALYQATLNLRWLKAALNMPQVILHLFFDSTLGGFFQTSPEHEHLVVRRKEFLDSAIPSGNSQAAELFLRLGKLVEREDYVSYATTIMQMMADAMTAHPNAFGRLLSALDFHLHPGYEIAIAGEMESPETQALLEQVWSRFLPNSVLALREPDGEAGVALVPFLVERHPIEGKPAAYVCRHYACLLPVTDPAALAAQLDA